MQVPADLRATIGRWAGEPGQVWLAALPRLVAELAERWSLTLGEPYQPSGYTSLALPVTRDGTPYVLKVRIPDEWSAGEAAALRHYGGGACVALADEDAERWALLLERCTPGTPLLAEPDDDAATAVVAGLLTELWSPPPPGHAFRLLADDAAAWLDLLRTARHVPERVRAEAYELLSWLVADLPPPVVLHTDLHAGNVLRAERRPWLAIDPKGAVGDPAFDLAPVVRDRAAPGLVARRLAIVSEVTGIDRRRARGWALVQCAEGAEWSYAAGDRVAGDEFVAWAHLVAATPG